MDKESIGEAIELVKEAILSTRDRVEISIDGVPTTIFIHRTSDNYITIKWGKMVMKFRSVFDMVDVLTRYLEVY